MADILKITTPMAGYENTAVRNQPQGGSQIQNPVDHAKGMGGGHRTDAGENRDTQMALKYGSNFASFLAALEKTPDIISLLSEMFFQESETGGAAGETKTLLRCFQSAQMEEGDLVPFMKELSQGAVRFQGSLFQRLRGVMAATNSIDLKAEVLDFIRKYNDMSSGEHLLRQIFQTIKEMEGHLLKGQRGELESLSAKLNPSAAAGDTHSNSQLLKEEIMPFLGRVIGSTHDMGTLRDKISLFTVLISRYENGNQAEVLKSFSRLSGYQGFREFFGDINAEQFQQVMDQAGIAKLSGKNEWADGFADFLKAGLNGAKGMEHKQVFHNIIHSMIMNESVYLPLLHLAFPIELKGKKMFSEIWIDPDEEGSSTQSGLQSVTRIFAKFDIKDLGAFKLIMLYSEKRASVWLYYPEKLKRSEEQILKGVEKILTGSGIITEQFIAAAGGGPNSPIEVFPKIQERKSGVNVTI